MVVAVGDGLGGDTCMDAHAEAAQLLRDQRGHLNLEGRQDVPGALDEVGLEASLREGLGGLDADETGAEDDRSRSRGLAQGESVVDRAQGVHARGVEAVDRGPAREGTRGEDQVVVGERVSLAGLSVSNLDAAGTRVDRRDLGVDAHVEVERSLEGVRGVEEELGGVFDLAADVVRESAVREGHVLAALQHDDLGALVAPAQACRRAHATRDSSDDNYSHVRLTFWLGLVFFDCFDDTRQRSGKHKSPRVYQRSDKLQNQSSNKARADQQHPHRGSRALTQPIMLTSQQAHFHPILQIGS